MEESDERAEAGREEGDRGMEEVCLCCEGGEMRAGEGERGVEGLEVIFASRFFAASFRLVKFGEMDRSDLLPCDIGDRFSIPKPNGAATLSESLFFFASLFFSSSCISSADLKLLNQIRDSETFFPIMANLIPSKTTSTLPSTNLTSKKSQIFIFILTLIFPSVTIGQLICVASQKRRYFFVMIM